MTPRQLMNWTEQEVELLKGWLAEGLSSSQICERFLEIGRECTRNSVIGKAGRMGLKLTGKSGGARPPGPHRRKRVKAQPTIAPTSIVAPVMGQKHVVAVAIPDIKNEDLPEPIEARVEAGPASGGVHLLHLKHNSCRFPLWGYRDKPSLIFCGEPVDHNSAWCKAHRHHLMREVPIRA
jgi:hypothetical protein